MRRWHRPGARLETAVLPDAGNGVGRHTAAVNTPRCQNNKIFSLSSPNTFLNVLTGEIALRILSLNRAHENFSS